MCGSMVNIQSLTAEIYVLVPVIQHNARLTTMPNWPALKPFTPFPWREPLHGMTDIIPNRLAGTSLLLQRTPRKTFLFHTCPQLLRLLPELHEHQIKCCCNRFHSSLVSNFTFNNITKQGSRKLQLRSNENDISYQSSATD